MLGKLACSPKHVQHEIVYDRAVYRALLHATLQHVGGGVSVQNVGVTPLTLHSMTQHRQEMAAGQMSRTLMDIMQWANAWSDTGTTKLHVC